MDRKRSSRDLLPLGADAAKPALGELRPRRFLLLIVCVVFTLFLQTCAEWRPRPPPGSREAACEDWFAGMDRLVARHGVADAGTARVRDFPELRVDRFLASFADAMTDFLEQWATKNEANAKLLAQEVLITRVTEEIWKAMDEAGINQAELARKMGATKGHVSQVLNGSRNMTLRTLADICFALDYQPVLRLESKKPAAGWQTTGQNTLSLRSSTLRYIQTGTVIRPVDRWQTAVEAKAA